MIVAKFLLLGPSSSQKVQLHSVLEKAILLLPVALVLG
jgi:hypothetical protein